MRSPEDSAARVAIIGMSGRFPGAPSVDALWSNLRGGVESIVRFSREDAIAAGTDGYIVDGPDFVGAGAPLEGIESFDADLFGFSALQAEALDPQQRVFLECAWEALEQAGYASGRPLRAGVYAGTGLSSYLFYCLLHRRDLLDALGDIGMLSLNDKDWMGTHLSWLLDLTGPALAIQTGCSTGLYTVHAACQALLAGECDVAVAGASYVVIPQHRGYQFVEGGILSRDGRCRVFSDAADGTVLGSAAGVVVLKRLDDALAARDPIRAVILGTATNNDGSAKPTYTAPSAEGQAGAIAEALAVAGVDARSIGYVEAHGTATALGDPIEVAGLTRAFRRTTAGVGYCALGSIKANIGHADTAAGTCGLIKAALCVERGEIPPTIHFERPNPRLELERSPFYVNRALLAWPEAQTPRRAGVSSFGIGGTNVHLVLEQPPPRAPGDGACRSLELLVMSAKTPAALDRMTENLARHLDDAAVDLADAAYTLQVGRKQFAHRRVILARSRLDLGDPARVLTAPGPVRDRPVAFLFPGQGTQCAGMGEVLYARERVFRDRFDACAEILRAELDRDLRDLVFAPAQRRADADRVLRETRFAQPALFAIEYALASQWLAWGVAPRAMLGHSLGEYVAAHLAGVFSLEDALRLVSARGRLIQELPGGAMTAVALSEAELAPLLAGSLAVAAVNAAARCAVAGTAEDVALLEAELAQRGVPARRLATSHAFHSAMMEPALPRFRELVARTPKRPPAIPFVSNVTGAWITAAQATSDGYWVDHLRQTVRFGDGLATLVTELAPVLVEVGPGATLTSLARRHAAERAVAAMPRDRDDDSEALQEAVARVWLAGGAIDWTKLHLGEPRGRIRLPTYPFQRRRYWSEVTGIARNEAARAAPVVEPPQARATDDELEAALCAVFARFLGLAEVAPTASLFELGGDSMVAVQLAAAVQRQHGRRVRPQDLAEAATPRALAARLRVAQAPHGLVELACGGAGRPLVLVHPVGGTVFCYRALAHALQRTSPRPVYGIAAELPGPLPVPIDPAAWIAELATRYVPAVAALAQPCHVAGASLGGAVAYELARRLAAEQLGALALIDTPAPGERALDPADDAAILRYMLDAASDDTTGGRRWYAALPADEAARWLQLWRAGFAGLGAYRPDPGVLDVHFVRAAIRSRGLSAAPDRAWPRLARELHLHVVPGDHDSMLQPPHVEVLAATLGPVLDAADAGAATLRALSRG